VVLLPLIAAFIAYEVVTFPAHLADKVSTNVAVELGLNFEQVNERILQQIVGQFTTTGVLEVGKLLAKDPDVQHSIIDLLTELS
jgi:hypothetical protein